VGWGLQACGWELVMKEATLGSTRLPYKLCLLQAQQQEAEL